MQNIFSSRNRALLAELVKTDFKLRYQGSVLGYTWSLLRPLLFFLILYVVFVKFLRLGGDLPHFPIYLLLGIVLWNFFSEITSQSLGAIVARGDLIRKTKMPRWIIIVSVSIAGIINLVLNLIVVGIFMVVNQVTFSASATLLFLVIAEIYLLALAVGLWLSAAFVKYRDIGYIWDVTTQALFYFTPILYSLSLIPAGNLRKIIMLNPMAQAIQAARYLVVTKQTITFEQVFGSFWYLVIPLGIVTSLLVLGALYFKRESKYFAENI